MTTLIPKFDLKDGGSTPAGAVNRPINEKLSESVSVKDFGATGNGTTDDTVAIQAALTSGAANVLFPSGTYKVTATLTTATNQVLQGEGNYASIITYTANSSIINQSVSCSLKNLQISVYAQGNAYTSTLISITTTSAAIQGNCLLDNVLLYANTTSATATAYALNASTTGYFAYNTVNGLITRGAWGLSIKLNCDASGSFIQANTFSNLNLTSQIFVSYPGAGTEIYGNLFSGSFQFAAAGTTDTNGTLIGPLWDQGSSDSLINPKQRSLIISDSPELFLQSSSTTKGAVGWSALQSNRFIQNGYLVDLNGTSQASQYEDNNFHKGGRGLKSFTEYCVGKQFDPKMTLTNMTASAVNGGQSGVIMSALQTSETGASASLALTNTGCSLSKFPTFFTTVKAHNNSGNVAAAFENTEHSIGLFDTSAGQNGVYVRREWPGSAAVVWNQYLEVISGGVIKYSQIINTNGTATPIQCNLDQTNHFNFWVDETNIYFQMTYENFNQVTGFQSAQRPGLNLWSGVMTIPLSTAGMFSTTAIELNPMYISTPAVFTAGELLLQWKRIELKYTDY